MNIECTGDLQGQVVLEREQVGQIPIVFLRQQVVVVDGVDQLRRDPDAVTRFLHAAFQHVPHTELFRHRPRRHRLAAINQGRVARDDE